MWECGLKLFGDGTGENLEGVTPYVGVWIETILVEENHYLNDVTPYVGVWIETARSLRRGGIRDVTPYVGVWIETRKAAANN